MVTKPVTLNELD